MKTATLIRGLEDLQRDIESGAIANPGAKGDRLLNKHEKFVTKLLEAIRGREHLLGE